MHKTKVPSKTNEPLQCSLCSQTIKNPAALKQSYPCAEGTCLSNMYIVLHESESDVKKHKDNVHTKLSCQLCPATFPTNQEEKLLAHMERMHQGKDRENAICADCGSQFKTQNQLKIHNQTKCGTVKQFQCEQCDSKFMTQNALFGRYFQQQEVNRVNPTLYKCELCPKILQGAYKTHLKTEHDIGIWKDLIAGKPSTKKTKTTKPEIACQYCFKKYTSSNLLEKHEKVHGENGTLIHKWSCCSTWFASTVECENHQSKIHKDKLFCKECNKMFKEPDNLVAHNRYSHSDVPHSPKKYTFVCPNCGRNFSSKVALSDHERSNCGNSPIYKCNVCRKSYNSAGSLKTHSSVHSVELPHLCGFCGKAFRTQGHVKIHEHNHNLQAHRKSHKSTCGMTPNVTKPVGTMGFDTVFKITDVSDT